MRLHIQLPTPEATRRRIDEFKIAAIGILYDGYQHLLSRARDVEEAQSCFLARNSLAAASSPSSSSPSSSSVRTYVPIDDHSVAAFDDGDLFFILTEGEDPLHSISEEMELLKFQTEKYCLVYIPDMADAIACECDRKNWLLEEEYPLLQQIRHNNGYTADHPLPSINFSIRRAYQVPMSAMSLSIVLIREKEESKGVRISKYLTYTISIKNNGLNWDVEHRFSDFKRLVTVLQCQSSEEIGM